MTKTELTVADSIRARRSIKSFKNDPIPEGVLQELLSLMQDAPSSWNFQPTRVVMIRSMAQKEALAAAAWGQKQILEAPVTFVFAVSIRGWEKNMGEILKSGVSSGAWPQKFADWIGENAPGFQKGLGDKEREYAIKDAIIMATTLALAAQSKGYSNCYINGWDEAKVKEIIGVEGDNDIAIALLLPIGLPNSLPKHPGRLPSSKTIFTDRISA
ncbi:MAG: nitroreductase [Verrucomicrobia bacterium]|jgi:nitroreductase|nr:nitroreductase [Verrucomicrobiota bacterium]NBS86805.1 nitroreductase [Verrucomicrobiota bacterium]